MQISPYISPEQIVTDLQEFMTIAGPARDVPDRVYRIIEGRLPSGHKRRIRRFAKKWFLPGVVREVRIDTLVFSEGERTFIAVVFTDPASIKHYALTGRT